VRFNDQPSPNLFVAGEMMAGNVLGKGYTAGVGMSIGTAFGRIAGTQAARAAKNLSKKFPETALAAAH
jgi:tricarballylate dehydrogenase